MNDATAMMDIDSLLDGTLDDLADMPEFKPFPIGAHRVTINMEQKVVGEIPSIEVKITALETVELTDPTATPCMAGDSTNVLFMLFKKDDKSGKMIPNELGQGQFKNFMTSIAPSFPELKSNREIMEAAQGLEVLMSTGQRVDRKDKTKVYTFIESVNPI